jgi:hypothetical protein
VEREEEREGEGVDESDEKVLADLLGDGERARRAFPRRLESVSCFSQIRPACSRRAGMRLREFPLRLGRLASKITAAKLIHGHNIEKSSFHPPTKPDILNAQQLNEVQ